MIEPGVYNVHNMTLRVREDGINVLQIEVAEPGQTRALAIVYTVLSGPPPTAEAAVIDEARRRAVHCLHTKYGVNDPLVEAFTSARDAQHGDEAWTPYYHDDPVEGVGFIRDWLIRDFEEFCAKWVHADVVAQEHENGGTQ